MRVAKTWSASLESSHCHRLMCRMRRFQSHSVRKVAMDLLRTGVRAGVRARVMGFDMRVANERKV